MNINALLSRFVGEFSIDVVLIAGRYTLLEQPALQDLLPRCVEYGVQVIAAGVYNSGLLADPHPAAPYNYVPAPPAILDRALRLREICGDHGVPLKAAALQFPLAHPAVRSVIVGAATPQEIEENERLRSTPIPTELWSELIASGLLPPDVPTP